MSKPEREPIAAVTEFEGPAGPAPATGPEEVVERLLLAEEAALLEVRRRSTGRVRVRTEVETTSEPVRAELAEEDVVVERVPVNAYVDTVPAIRAEGDVTVVPVFEEVLVVEKRLLLKEELHLRRVRKTEAVEVPVTLRRMRAVVEKVPAEPEADPPAESER